MTAKVFKVLLFVNVCGLWGCASSQQAPAADPKQVQAPAKTSVQGPRAQKAPVDVPKVKTSNEVVVRPAAVPDKEPKAAPKQEEPTPGKPAEMKVANGFDRNPYLASVLKPLVPAHSTLTQTAAGFKNEKQFIAALHLSKTLVIPFDQIKIRVTGKHSMSLSDSLRDIRPSLSKSMAKAEVSKAEQQAKNDESRAKDEAKKAEKLAKNGNSVVAGNLPNASSHR